MEERKRTVALVEFSTDRIQLANDGSERQRHVYQLQNRGPSSLKVRATVAVDSDPVFQLQSGSEEKYVAPGLKVPVVLLYSPHDRGRHQGNLEVYTNATLSLTVPIIALPPSPKLHLERALIDVGALVTDHQIYHTSFTLSNLGNQTGRFIIDTSPLPAWITLQPVNGRLKPSENIEIQIEISCKEIVDFSYNLRIHSTEEDVANTLSLTLCGHLQSRTLRLLDLHTDTPLECVTFDPTYYDTKTSRRVKLYNDSPVATGFLCLLDKGARGSEVAVTEGGGVAMACTEGGAGQARWREQGGAPPAQTLLSVEPSQDSLLPFEKRTLELTFAPKFVPAGSGWDHFQATPTRRDYTLYLRFMAVETNREGKSSSGDLEVAVCASALPVDVLLEPSTLQFGVCRTMHPTTQQFKIHNKSDTLPLHYRTHRLPHYTCHPPTGHIPPSQSHTLSLTFTPKQLGHLNNKLMIDILASKPKSASGDETDEVVKTLAVELRGEGVVEEERREEEEVGRREVIHAHPDDLSTSIRPYDGATVITPYTHTPRYTYVDRDYAYSEGEKARHQQHRDHYLHYLRNCQAHRQWRKEEMALSNVMRAPEKELGMLAVTAPSNSPTVSAGSPSKKKTTSGGKRKGRGGARGGRGGRGSGGGMMTIDDVLNATSDELKEVAIEQCSSRADSAQIASKSTSHLSPLQLTSITITPGVLDYSVMAVGSTVEKTLTVKNGLNQHINVTFKLAGSGVQYRHSPPCTSLPLVLPPSSFTQLPLTMHRSTEGHLERCVECSVNGRHTIRLPVYAESVPLSLALSTNTLTLSQPPMATPTAGLRGSLEVTNTLNVPAAFQWHAREGVDTTIFFMVHPTGVVPARSSLRCEFVCLPTHDSPDTALFRLVVVGEEGEGSGGDGVPGEGVTSGGVAGGTGRGVQKDTFLTLRAELGYPECSFREQRVLFGTVSLGLTTTRTVHLQNTGDYHAYFKVVNPEPCPGLTIHPESGCVPVGGATDLKLHLHPESVAVFDTELVVVIRGRRQRLALKLVGAAEEPTVTIDRESFIFGGVYCGSKSSLPFTVSNTGSTRCELQFDFSFLSDFSLTLPRQSSSYMYADVVSESSDLPGVYTLQLPAKTSAPCHLILSPRDVAAYDFQLPVLVNRARPPSPPPSPWPPSSHHTSKITIRPHPQQTNGKQSRELQCSYESTPCRRVLATAVRAPLSLSLSHFTFPFPVSYLETMTEPASHSQLAELKNVGDSPLTWTLVTSGVKRIEDGTFRLVLPSGAPLTLPPTDIGPPGVGELGYLAPQESFKFSVQCSPAHHGQFHAEVPLLLNESAEPYTTLTLSASVPVGKISMSTTCILLQPVPLDITISAQYTLLVQDFPNAVDIEAVVESSIPDCTSLIVRFPDGSHVTDCTQSGVKVPVVLEFTSSQPVTLTGHLIFRDTNTGKKMSVAYALAADNSVLSVAQFLAQSVNISSIQLNAHHVPMLNVSSGDGVVVSSTSSVVSLATSHTRYSTPLLTSSLTADHSYYSDVFMQECVNAVCRWMSGYGWSHGVKHISSPTDLRERVGHDVPKPGVKQRSSIKVRRGLLVELVTHLCGRLPPGIPVNPPPCTTSSEKINQQYSTLNTILAFLKNQGGQLWCLTADSLLDYRDYQQWLLDCGPSLLPPSSSSEEFQERSSQAWTYLLLLIVKVLVLPRVTRHVPTSLKPALRELDTQTSNVYGPAERVVLAWINHHYTQQRDSVLNCDGNAVYVRREVVSYDMDLMDGTVLACVLAAYCPFLASSHFTALYTHPTSAEQCSHNALILMDALKHIGITYDCQAADLITPTPVFLLLLCCHLYQCLPSLSPSPSRTVLCEGLLHSNIRQQITLENPSSNKPLVYKALLRGEDASKFSIAGGSDTITIAGRKSASFEVEYRGRQTRPCDAVLLLVPEGGCGTSGTSLAFQLQGRVTGAKPQSKVQVNAALYQVKSVTVQVTSPYHTASWFNIHLYETTDGSLLSALQSPTTRRKTATQSLGVIPTTALKKRSTDKMTVFNSQADRVYLEPSLPTTLTLTFVPLKMERRHCTIVLHNDDIGDIILSIRATVQLPLPTLPQTRGTDSRFFINVETQTLHLKAYAGETINEELLVISENESLQKALLEVCRWGMSEVELKRRMLTDSMKHAALTTAMRCLELEEKTPEATDDIAEDLDKLVFRVDGANELFKLPDTIAVPAGKGGVVGFPVQFRAEEPGQFECHVTLTSAHDVRVFIIECTVLCRGRQAKLEFTTTAMQPLTQDIPIVNPSTVEWPLQATLRGSGFIGPDSLLSRPLSTTCYPLTFNPKKEGLAEGELCLVNGNDGTEHRYQLRGVADNPLAQEHVVLRTQAKTRLTHILHVPNHNERTTVFKVETDLQCVSGPPSISIAGGDLVDYPLIVKPIRRGVMSGAVAFVAQTPSTGERGSLNTPCTERGSGTSQHVWFQLELRVDPAPPDHVIPITCPTLSSTLTHLSITNTQPHPLQLNVVVDGVGISEPDSLTAEANSVTTYPLTFAPTLNGQSTGQVVFDGDPDGEIWYQIQLSATDPAPVSLPELSCELGKTMQVGIPLTNPLDHSVVFSCQSSNTRHFIIPALIDSQVEVEAGGGAEVSVLFKPSSVASGEHVTHISFTSQEFGVQVFTLQGRGCEPLYMDTTTIHASLNSSSTHVIPFTNPLDIPAHFQVTLTDTPSSQHFCLLLKRTHGILLHPGVTLDVPVMFAPEAMHTHRTSVIVSIDTRRDKGKSVPSSLAWEYPVVGEPEFRPLSPDSAPQIACQAKERAEERLEVVLVGRRMSKAATFRPVTPNLEPSSASPLDLSKSDCYSYQLVCSETEYATLVQNSVGVKLLRITADQDQPVKLVFGIVFVPPKAFSCTAELNVSSRDGGGVWKFPVHLSASTPDPDDVITIEAAGLNKESQIRFRLTSLQEHPLPFTAHLAQGSDPDITVSPTSGELAPVNSRGTLFFITYKPLTYGRDHKAKLIVQCQSNEWCYEIVGRPSPYSPPHHTPARVHHRTTPPLVLTQTRKNFVRENMKLCTSRLV